MQANASRCLGEDKKCKCSPVGLRLRRESLKESEPAHPSGAGARACEERAALPSRVEFCVSEPRDATIWPAAQKRGG
jgi:hypothetical protein